MTKDEKERLLVEIYRAAFVSRKQEKKCTDAGIDLNNAYAELSDNMKLLVEYFRWKERVIALERACECMYENSSDNEDYCQQFHISVLAEFDAAQVADKQKYLTDEEAMNFIRPFGLKDDAEC